VGGAAAGIVLARAVLSPHLARSLPERVARDALAVPLARTAEGLAVAVSAPSDALRHRLAVAAGCPVRLSVCYTAADLQCGIEMVYGTAESTGRALEIAIGATAVVLGYLPQHQLDAYTAAPPGGRPLTLSLLASGSVSGEALAGAIALTLGLPYVRLGEWPAPPGIVRVLPCDYSQAYGLAPFALYRGRLLVAISHPRALSSLPGAAHLSGFSVAPVVASQAAIQRLVETAWSTETARQPAGGTPRAAAASPRRRTAFGMLPQRELGVSGEFHGHPDLQLARRLPRGLVSRLGAVPVSTSRGGYVLASNTPLDPSAVSVYAALLGGPISSVVVQPDLVSSVLQHLPPGDPQPPVVWPEAWWTEEQRFPQFLASLGYCTAAQLRQAEAALGSGDGPMESFFLEAGILGEWTLLEALSLWLGVPFAQTDHWLPTAEVAECAPAALVEQYRLLPLWKSPGGLTVAAWGDARAGVEALAAAVGRPVRMVLTPRATIDRALRQGSGQPTPELPERFAEVTAALLHAGLLSPADRMRWATEAAKSVTPAEAAVQLDSVAEADVASAVAAAFALPLADLSPEERLVPVIDPLGNAVTVRRVLDPVQHEEARRLNEADARRYGALPLRRDRSGLVVAFAWPTHDTVAAVRQAVGEPVTPVVARHSQLIAGIARHLGRLRLGDELLLAGLVTAEQLDAAAGLAQRAGLRLGEALVSLGAISERQLAMHLATQFDLPWFSLTDAPEPTIDSAVCRLLPEAFAHQHRLLPLAKTEDGVLLGVVDPLDRESIAEAGGLLGAPLRLAVITPSDFASGFAQAYQQDHLYRSAFDLMTRSPEDSAQHVLSRRQKVTALVLAAMGLSAFIANPIGFLTALVALTNAFYFVISCYKFYIINRALQRGPDTEVNEEELAALEDRDLPVYTILVPLYREAAVLHQLVDAIDRLDYPKAKLDVKLLLEDDDVETIQAARTRRLPAHFQLVLVPAGEPRGKPRACNFGLLRARGVFTVIFDAEDVPDPLQLKKVIVTFRKGAANLGCVQCKLNYYNQNHNLLTKWFTSEYSMWFDLFLPGLDAVHSPIPLGGTSNHFPTAVLQELGAWDPHNVTEDADLGIRLFKRGYTTAVVDSTTYEEANSRVHNWLRQRSRWVKGYMQTWLVHMRHPVALYRSLGFWAFFSVQMTIFGTFFTFLVNPVFWVLTPAYFLTRAHLIEELFPGPIYYAGAFSLFFGNFVFTYAAMLGCLRRRYFSLIKYNIIVMCYWGMMSLAAWKALAQLVRRPHYWEKTIHGLYRGPVHIGPPAGEP